MFVLSRKKGESIMFGPESYDGEMASVVVVEVRADGKVRIGIDAPQTWFVLRREVFDAIRREDRQLGDDEREQFDGS